VLLLLIAAISFTCSACAMALLNYLGARPWRKAQAKHWSLRARALFPARTSAPLNLFLIPAGIYLLTLIVFPEAKSTWLVSTGAALLGALLGMYPLSCSVLPEYNFRTWLVHTGVGLGVKLAYYGALAVAIACAPRSFDWPLLLYVIAYALWHYWFATSGFIHLWSAVGAIKAAPLDFVAALSLCFKKAGLQPRTVWILDSPAALAYAVPHTRDLIFSEGLARKCEPPEISAICHHELGHLAEDRSSLRKRALASYLFVPFILTKAFVSAWGITGMLPLLLVFGSLVAFASRLGRALEVRADACAVEQEREAGAYARALEKLYMLNLIPAVLPRKRRTHPDLYDRMVSAGLTPDFERPRPPASLSWTSTVLFVLIAILMAYWIHRNAELL
jgi:Zn-dependent protease with chaperone function